MSHEPALPLAGTRIVDMTQVLAGPFATTILGDLGADVIKVEPPKGDPTRAIGPYWEGESHYFLSINRNKRSIALDLKSEGADAALHGLLQGADVLIENFRPGVLERLLGTPDAIMAEYPRLVVCSISGFGQTGAERLTPSFDLVTQALSGAMSITGEPDDAPMRSGIPIGDLMGGLYGVIAVLAALYRRDARGGRAQYLDVSLLDSLTSLLGYVVGRFEATGEIPGPVGSGHHSTVPYRAFRVTDGYVVIAILTDAFWPRLCDALSLEYLAVDPRFATADGRTAGRVEINRAIAAAVENYSVEECLDHLKRYDIPCAPIADVEAVVNDAQLRSRNMIRVTRRNGRSFRYVGSPLAMSGLARRTDGPPPSLGEHSEELLREAGVSEADIRTLIAKGALYVHSR